MSYVAWTGLAEDTRGHGMSENAMHTVLWDSNFASDFSIGDLAMEGN
jgi:hypothetical protein